MKTFIIITITISSLLWQCNSDSSDNSGNIVRLLALQQPGPTVTQPTLSIRGQLKDSSGNAISGATLSTGLTTSLSVRGVASRASSTTTDSSGYYNLNLSTGNHTISVKSASGEDLGNIVYKLANVTDKPTATTDSAEITNTVGLTITINSTLPEAISAVFTDTDTTIGSLGGTMTIQKASDESNIVSYALFWADANQKAMKEIAVFDVTGNKIIYILSTGTSIESGAKYLQIRSLNSKGEYSKNGINVTIEDK